jgi:phosphoribosylglycinamide formyltransferase 1
MTKNIAIFASGGGSNALKIIQYFQNHEQIKVALIIANKPNIGVLKIADEYEIPSAVINRQQWNEEHQVIELLEAHSIELIVLAGFLWLMPSKLVSAFPNKILNIHPALLPKYGGKGMYGHFVHEAVKAAGEHESGMTIHFVNEKYDEGHIIFQAKCKIAISDSAEDIARKVLALEHEHYARIIETLLT